jgi:C1A family cysteine protease
MGRFGWQPDTPDIRDFRYQVTKPVPLPASVDLRPKMPAVYDQGDLGSCTANAIAAAFEYEQVRAGLADFMPSRLFIYFNERRMEGTINSDAGAMIRDGIKSVNKMGVCSEIEWPYRIKDFAKQPPAKVYDDARFHRSIQYFRLTPTLSKLKQCLASGNPFTFGFTVYESFESDAVAKSGIVPLPQPDEDVLGGHAVLAVAYNEQRQRFIARNSYGAEWGQRGYFEMPYAYLLEPNLSDDFWVIERVGGLQQ